MRTLLILLVLGFASPAPACRLAQFDPSRWSDSLSLLNKLIRATPESSPEHPELHYQKALMYLEHARWLGQSDPQWAKYLDECVASLRFVMRRFPRYRDMDTIYQVLIVAHLERGQEQAALRVFGQMRKRFPRSFAMPYAWYTLGNHYLETQNWRRAARYFRKLERYPTFKHHRQAWLKAAAAEAQYK